MKPRGRPLTAAGIRSASKPGSYGDGRGGYGLRLVVRKRTNGRVAKYWTQRIVVNGKPTNIGLGVYPLVGLAEARQVALRNARELSAGRDPRRGGMPTFEAAATRVIQLRRAGWKPGSRTEVAWRNTFETYTKSIAAKPVDQITTGDLLAIVGPLWHDKPSVGRALRERFSAVFRLAIAEGWRSDDPAGPPLLAALPKGGGRKTEHFRALGADEVAEAIRRVRESNAMPTVRLLIEWVALTAVRTVEARLSTWSEFNTDAAIWSIPPDKTKTGDPHRVALSTPALTVLDKARRYSGPHSLVFPSRTGRPISHGTPSQVFRKLEIPGTIHGLRSSFRTWAAEAGYPREICEAALGHRTGNAVEVAYSRTDFLEQRRELMNHWGEYLTG
ncbi:MAG: tyrosine-type recombinase/integrase [bacterium]|nr:tyrosine-type recombinase/integrase [bacterium]